MGLGQMAEHFPDIFQEKLAAALGNTQKHVQLGQADNDGRRVHEPKNDRMRDEIDDGPELDQAQKKLNKAHQHGQEQGQGYIFRGVGHGQRRDRSGGHEGNDGHRPCGQLPRRAPQSPHNGRNKGRIQTEIQGQTRKLGIGHGLGHQDQSAGDAGHEVGAQN